MRPRRAAKIKRYITALCSAGILLFFVSGLGLPVFAGDKIDVKRDDEKTVYAIGPSDDKRQEEARERDRAWDMLRNMGVIVDKRSGQPAQGQAAQPGAGK